MICCLRGLRLGRKLAFLFRSPAMHAPIPTDDVRIEATLPLITPDFLIEKWMPTPADVQFVAETRTEAANVLALKDPRLLVVVGPCSIHDEAAALVNTWRSSYFDHEGLRVLFILPKAWTDTFIPMRTAGRPA